VARHHRQFAQAGMAVVIAVVAMLGAVVPAAAAPDQRYYLSLGDSLAYGFQRAKAVCSATLKVMMSASLSVPRKVGVEGPRRLGRRGRGGAVVAVVLTLP
jgi:hypothetical protein